MCGIFGVVGCRKNLGKILFTGIKRLEYRGYDSVGMAAMDCSKIVVKKGVGDVAEVNKKTHFFELKGSLGLAHTRWASCGRVTKQNAHPHQSCDKKIAIVHNGIIENFEEIKGNLIKKKHTFFSDTDSEVIAHYFEEKLKNGNMKKAIMDFFKDAKGTFAVLMVQKGMDKIYAIKRDSPLALGLCKNSNILASDIHAFSDKTNRAIFFEDNEFAVVENSRYRFFDKEGKEIKKKIHLFKWKTEKLQKRFQHYMLKEINEEPFVTGRLLNSLRTIQRDNVNKIISLIKKSKRIVFLASGTSYHAAMVGEHLFNKVNFEAFALNASDFSGHLIKENTLVVALTQSGETMDVIKSIKGIKNAKVVSIVNVPYSTIHRLSALSLEIAAGQEICVASTKSFVNQILTLMYLAQFFGYETDLNQISKRIESTIKKNENSIKRLADAIYRQKDLYVVGRGANFPAAKEIALKIKEISYLHAEGMQSGELKHGTIALVDKGVPVISLIPDNDANLIHSAKEVQARGAFTITITNKKTDLRPNMNFKVPYGDNIEFALYSTVIGQLMAYYIALKLKRPIDKPKHLAKSVTVL